MKKRAVSFVDTEFAEILEREESESDTYSFISKDQILHKLGTAMQ